VPRPIALVIEPDRTVSSRAAQLLERQGFEALTSSDAEHGLSLARARRPALILVDINPPGMGGFELCRQIREFSVGHLIVLTERTDEIDPVAGMAAGVDDYLTKPFSTRTLAVRLEAMSHQRHRPAGTQRLGFGDLSIDPAGRQARLLGEVLDLTKTEFDLLTKLASEPGRVFTRRQLLDALWGTDWSGSNHVVSVCVANLRRKLGESADHPHYIHTVRGVGFRFRNG